jgi:hypothetical protein
MTDYDLPTKRWQDIQLESPSFLSVGMRDPIEFARWRIHQNVQSGLDECSFFRQTGRTYRLALRVLDHAYKNETCIIFFQSKMMSEKFFDLLVDWVDQLSMRFEPQRWSGKGLFLTSKKGGVRVTITHLTVFGLNRDSMFRGTSYDYVYFDNEFLDAHVDSKSPMTPVFSDIVEVSARLLTRRDRGRHAECIFDISGNTWRPGDLFKMPNLSAVGTLIDLNRSGCIPISLTVLYNGDLIKMPWDACDVLLKTTDVS